MFHLIFERLFSKNSQIFQKTSLAGYVNISQSYLNIMIQIDRDPLLGSYIFISDQKVKAESNRNRNCNFFASLGNPKGGTFFYASHICQNFLYKPISISMI